MHPSLRMSCLLVASNIALAPAIAQQTLDIVEIMGQFIQARYAASKCANPDPETLARFVQNLEIVSIRATEEMRKRNPAMSEHSVQALFERGSDAVARRIDGVLAANGCSDPRIQDLLRRFEIQANLKL